MKKHLKRQVLLLSIPILAFSNQAVAEDIKPEVLKRLGEVGVAVELDINDGDSISELEVILEEARRLGVAVEIIAKDGSEVVSITRVPTMAVLQSDEDVVPELI